MSVVPVFSGDVPWKEMYIVSAETAEEINSILVESGVFSWQSMRDAAGTDGLSWELVVKNRKGGRRVLVSNDCGLTFADYSAFERGDLRSGDSDVKQHAERVFTLLERVRSMARRSGELQTDITKD
jgi:hypothetical protein